MDPSQGQELRGSESPSLSPTGFMNCANTWAGHDQEGHLHPWCLLVSPPGLCPRHHHEAFWKPLNTPPHPGALWGSSLPWRSMFPVPHNLPLPWCLASASPSWTWLLRPWALPAACQGPFPPSSVAAIMGHSLSLPVSSVPKVIMRRGCHQRALRNIGSFCCYGFCEVLLCTPNTYGSRSSHCAVS